jgi:hypothetical protein
MANVFGGGSPLKLAGAVAGSGLTSATAQYKYVKFSADNTVVLCSATTDIPCGVLQAPVVATGDPVDVVVIGETPLQAGGSVTAGTAIATNASGQAQTAVSGQYVVGQPQNVAGATTAGTLITAVVNCATPVLKA